MKLRVGMKLELRDKIEFRGYEVGKKGDVVEVIDYNKFVGWNIQFKCGTMFIKDYEIDRYFREYVGHKKAGKPRVKQKAKSILNTDDLSINYEYVDTFISLPEERIVIVKLKSGNIGKAKCMPEDKFDEEKGKKIAYAKAMIKDFDDIILNS